MRLEKAFAHNTFFFCLFFLFVLSNKQDNTLSDKFISVLPSNLRIWQLSTPPEIYHPENLYEYIDGGAELYLSFGFSELISTTYQSDQAAPIRVDIFDMSDSRNAFGVFTHSRETVERDFGQGSQVFAGLLLFWQDRYFVSILCSPETELSRSAVFDLGHLIESVIADTGQIPELIQQLPSKGLERASIKYFKHPAWLNTHFFISNDNLLRIDADTECVLARYDLGIVLLVAYDSDIKSQAAYKDFGRYYYSESEYSGVPMKGPGEKWSVSQVSGSYIMAVFDVSDPDDALDLIKRLQNALNDVQ